MVLRVRNRKKQNQIILNKRVFTDIFYKRRNNSWQCSSAVLGFDEALLEVDKKSSSELTSRDSSKRDVYEQFFPQCHRLVDSNVRQLALNVRYDVSREI